MRDSQLEIKERETKELVVTDLFRMFRSGRSWCRQIPTESKARRNRSPPWQYTCWTR